MEMSFTEPEFFTRFRSADYKQMSGKIMPGTYHP